MRHRLTTIAAILSFQALAGGCESTKTCTLIGCVDGFIASVQRADGTFPAGMHRIEALVDGTTLRCAFTFPLPMLQNGGDVVPACDVGLQVMISPARICVDTHNDAGASSTCDLIPGLFMETITLAGRPGQVHVWQYVDDMTVLDAAVAPQYQESRPNGPACDPVCHQATASWTLL
jgi:hypothetical protein